MTRHVGPSEARMPFVETPQGRLEGAHAEVAKGAHAELAKGAHADGVAAFLGIPYAEAPVGALRLRPPRPARGWRGTRDATRFGAAQPQREDPLVGALGLLHGAHCDEDCLTLSVFTPACDAAARPVLVWLHGGAFIGGTACVPLYDGRRLAARGDVVVVTLNYRVGALGFSFAPASGDEHVANTGLWDQIAALRWVRDSIAAFGGDPTRVTVFGESAGAGSILALAGMPAAEGLFTGAIVQSAAPRGMVTPAEAEARTGTVLAKLGAPGGGAQALRDAPLAALLEAQYACADAGPHRTGMFYTPVPDGRGLVDPPAEAFTRGFAAKLPLLIGTTRDEMRLYVLGPLDSEAIVAHIVAPQLTWLEEPARSEAARELIAVHRSERTARGEPCAPTDLFLAIQTDLSLRYHSARIAELRAPSRNTWMYQFTWTSPLRGGLHGACHALDLPFTFGTLDAPGMLEFAGAGEAAQRLSGAMMDAWCAFARRGDPSCDATGSWPTYTPERRATLELGARCGVLDAPQEPERSALDRIGCI